MQDVIDWFWNFGCKREGKYSIGVGQWLDTITRMNRRAQAVAETLGNDRACLAVWGPSQTGKSTMISDAIDADDPGDGSCSALTWTDEEPARFTGILLNDDKTVIFNPYNGNSDGSGVTTRYVLKGDGEVKDPRHPAKIIFASRAQVMLALAIGYLEECSPAMEKQGPVHRVFDLAAYENEIKNCAGMAKSAGVVDRRAVELLEDLADVIEIETRTQDRFRNLASEWDRLRPGLFANKGLLADYDAALHLAAVLLWDGAKKLTDIFRRLMAKLDYIQREWKGKTIYASLRATNMFLDINTVDNFMYPIAGFEVPPVNKLCATIDGDAVYIDTFSSAPTAEIAGVNFGLVQALIGELQVPLRKERLAQNGKDSFLHFLEKADFLDFPGVPNRETGSKADVKVNVNDDDECTDREMLCKILKQGKTLSLIFMHAQRLGIDSFVILKRFRDYAKNTAVLANGIQAWLQAFEPGWKPGAKSPLPYYIDLTFFAEEARKAYTGAVNAETMKNFCAMITQLSFATTENARFFVTTYPKLGGQGEYAFPSDRSPEEDTRVMSLFCNAPDLRATTGLTDEDYRHVFKDEDGGVSYLFEQIASSISQDERLKRCKGLVAGDLKKLLSLLEPNLPVAEDAGDVTLKAELGAVIKKLSDSLEAAKNSERLAVTVAEVSTVIKQLMTLPPESLDPIPMDAKNKMKSTQMRNYVERQLGNWCEYQVLNSGKMPFIGAYFDNFQKALSILINALSLKGEEEESCLDKLQEFVFRQLPVETSDSLSASIKRKFLATAITNALFYGDLHRPSSGIDRQSLLEAFKSDEESLESYPSYYLLIRPFLERLEAICKASDKPPVRPPQAGDAELSALYAAYQEKAL